MAWIHVIPYEQSKGLLRQLYDEALARAGRIWKIVSVMSLRPRTMRASLALYQEIMMGESELTRVQREMLATVVSAAVQCRY